MRCEHCQHWTKSPLDPPVDRFARCGMARSVFAGIQQAANLNFPMLIDENCGTLITRADFGCVLFEANVDINPISGKPIPEA